MTKKRANNNNKNKSNNIKNNNNRIKRPVTAGRNANYMYSAGQTNYSVRNGTGVLHVPGRVRDAGRYGERLRGNKTYPNRRRKIITGRELTTPLRRKAIIDAQKERYRKVLAQEKVSLKYRTVSVAKQKFPVSAVFVVFITTAFLLGLICSYIVLNEKNVEINRLRDDIIYEDKRTKVLERELDIKNDLNYIINYATSDLEMVKEDLLQKNYVSVKTNDKVEVMADKSGMLIDFPALLSAIFKK